MSDIGNNSILKSKTFRPIEKTMRNFYPYNEQTYQDDVENHHNNEIRRLSVPIDLPGGLETQVEIL